MTNPGEPEKVWLDGNCHCAAIKFRVKHLPLKDARIMNCNCSICSKNGYLNVYPATKDIEIYSGKDSLKSYYFGNKKCAHQFCPNCGSSLFITPHMESDDLMVVNVRMIKDIDLDSLTYRKYDGKTELDPPYNP